MNIFSIIGGFLSGVILTALVGLYTLLAMFHIPSALGFSIVLLTALIRLLLSPLTASQYHLSQKQKQLAPHISNIKELHKGDQKRIQEETMKLYKEHGVNPASGCLMIVIQFPILITLYTVLQKIVGSSPQQLVEYVNNSVFLSSMKLHTPWDQHFFGIPLGQSPSKLINTIGVIAIFIPVLTGVLQFIQSKMIFPSPDKQNKDEKKDNKEDFAQAFQAQSLYIFPAMIGFLSFTFPIGLSLYWNTFSLFGILQQYKILKEYKTLEILKQNGRS